jgi:hypothetical protein
MAVLLKASSVGREHSLTFSRVFCHITVTIRKIIILPLALYGCEISSLILRERHVVKVKNCVFWDVTPCGSCKN